MRREEQTKVRALLSSFLGLADSSVGPLVVVILGLDPKIHAWTVIREDAYPEEQPIRTEGSARLHSALSCSPERLYPNHVPR